MLAWPSEETSPGTCSASTLPVMRTIQLNIHPNARSRFDADATALLGFVTDRPPTTPAPPEFPDDIEKTEIPSEDVKDFRREARDESGRLLEYEFAASGKLYVVDRDGCAAVATLAQRICANRELSLLLSRTFVEGVALSWVIDRMSVIPVEPAFCDYFIGRAQEAVKKLKVWTPIANLVVQSPFRFAGTTIRTLPAATVIGWESHAIQETPEAERYYVVGYFARLRKFFQGYAAFVFEIEAEPLRAEEYAHAEAERALALLGIYSGAVLHPDAKCPFSMRGTWSVPGATFILESDGALQAIKSGVRGHPSGMLRMKWSDADLERLRTSEFETASALLALPKPNDFQAAILNALFLYARAAYTDESIDKVVHVLSSLESMMLKDENEPIQQNLGERIAVFTQTDLIHRKTIIQAIKAAYRLRSRYLHHGLPPSDDAIIQNLLVIAWDFYVKLMAASDRHTERLEFVQWIDDAKLS